MIKIISAIIRNLLLKNPFEYLGNKAWFANLITEVVLQFVSYHLVGMVYISRSAPEEGSLLFLLVYLGLYAVLLIMSIHQFVWWWVLSVTALVIAVVVVIQKIYRKTIRRS